MRVLLDCRMATWSGIGRYCQGLVRALAEQPDFELVQMVAAGSAPPVPDADAVEARRHPFGISGALEFGSIARRTAPDVVHALHFPTPLPAMHPLVVTMQDLTPLAVPGVMPTAVKRAAYRWWTGRAARIADSLITPSEYSARDLERFFPGSAARARAIPLAADDFTGGPTGSLPAWLEGRRYILSMGNTKPHKDLPTLIKAFAALSDDSLLLVLAGTDPGDYAASVLAGDSAAARVRFTGRVTDDALRALYAGAVLFAYPSLYEGFGLPPLEAMALGTPVVVAGAASVLEVVGDAALVVAPGEVFAFKDAMERVIGDSGLSADLVARGHARARELTWAHAAKQTVQVYREVLGR
ncbi:MAG: glycosyltransferase family 1 protein [Actinobacteria bacterium]|nr:glycosyltransferase family 1 protein [Actinomycetota bacterium]